EPTPREYLAPNDPPPRLTSLRERWRILSGAGLDYLWLLRFGEALRNLPGEDFAQLLARELRPRVVVIGHDFRFGRHGEATAAVRRQPRYAPHDRWGRGAAGSAPVRFLRRAVRSRD